MERESKMLSSNGRSSCHWQAVRWSSSFGSRSLHGISTCFSNSLLLLSLTLVLLPRYAVAGGAIKSADAEQHFLQLTPEQQNVIFEEANELYLAARREQIASGADAAKSDFVKAAKRYQLLIDSNVDSEQVFVNAGHANSLADRPARALACYLNALSRSPGDVRLRHLVRRARRDLFEDANDTETAWLTLLLDCNDVLRLETKVLVAVGSWIVFWLTMGLNLLHSSRVARLFVWLSCLSLVLSIASLTLNYFGSEQRARVVILEPAQLFQSPIDGSGMLESLGSKFDRGTVLPIVEKEDGWYRVETESKRLGWLQASQAAYVAQPRWPWQRVVRADRELE